MAHDLVPEKMDDMEDEPVAKLSPRDAFDLSAVQLATYGEEFLISEVERRLADEYIRNGGNMRAAGKAIRPNIKSGAASAWARNRLAKPGVVSYMKWRRAQILMRSDVTAEELIEKERQIFLIATGKTTVRKSVINRDPESGYADVDHHDVYEPSLPAANMAVENLRKIAGIGAENKNINIHASVQAMSSDERKERLAEIMSKHGMVLDG